MNKNVLSERANLLLVKVKLCWVLCWHFFHVLFWHFWCFLFDTHYCCYTQVSAPCKCQWSLPSQITDKRPHSILKNFSSCSKLLWCRLFFFDSGGISSPKVVASNDSGEIQAGTGDLVVSSMGKWSLNGAISSNPWNWNGRWVVTYARRFTTLGLTNFSNWSRETKDSESNKSPFDIILYQHLAASHP